jgi:hypothetical protein
VVNDPHTLPVDTALVASGGVGSELLPGSWACVTICVVCARGVDDPANDPGAGGVC